MSKNHEIDDSSTLSLVLGYQQCSFSDTFLFSFLLQVPGVGKATIEKLVKLGIHNTWQLIGDMLKHVDGEFTDEKSIKKFGDIYWNRLVRDFACPAVCFHLS